MRWIVNFLLVFFILILLIILFLIFIKIKAEVRWTQEEQWIEFRYLMFKYRLSLDELFDKNSKEGIRQESVEKDKVFNSTPLKGDSESPSQAKAIHLDKSKKGTNSIDSNHLKSENFKTDSVSKTGTRWIKSIRARIIPKPPKALNISFIRKVNINYIRVQYRRFKIVFKEGKRILYRLFGRVRISCLKSSLHFNVDDPVLNAHLITIVRVVEANFYQFLKRRFKKVKNHYFDAKTRFSGNDIFFELSCIVSIRMVDIIIVGLFSLKEIFYIKKIIFIEKEV